MFRSVLARSLKTSAVSAVRLNTTRAALPQLSRASVFNVQSNRLNAGKLSSVRFYSHAPELTKELIAERVVELLEGFDKVQDKSKIAPEANFTKDLGLDSLDVVEVVMAIEEEFSISIGDQEADEIKSVQQAIDFIAAQPDAV